MNRISRIRYRLKCVSNGKNRISVIKSNRHVGAQIIDSDGVVIYGVVSNSRLCPVKNGTKLEKARWVGGEIGKMVVKIGYCDSVYYDRSGYIYHGVVHEVAEGVRKCGVNI